MWAMQGGIVMISPEGERTSRSGLGLQAGGMFACGRQIEVKMKHKENKGGRRN